MSPSADHQITVDASGSWGCGAAFETQLLQLAWSTEWENVDIMVKELASTVLSYVHSLGTPNLQKEAGIQV